jgi:hypothetical protein
LENGWQVGTYLKTPFGKVPKGARVHFIYAICTKLRGKFINAFSEIPGSKEKTFSGPKILF